MFVSPRESSPRRDINTNSSSYLEGPSPLNSRLSAIADNSSSIWAKIFPIVLVGACAAAVGACISLITPSTAAYAQPDKYMTGADWERYLSADGCARAGSSWFARWNTMAQPRIDQLAALVELKGNKNANGDDKPGGDGEPFRVAMVGDSTMMQQHGVICAFLGQHAGSRFDPAVHQEECCIDTSQRDHPGGESVATNSTSGIRNGNDRPEVGVVNSTAGPAGPQGGRGVCFRHSFQRFAEPPEWESLGSPDVVYFGSGLHFLHMTRHGHPPEAARVQGWLNYERDLENAVNFYRAAGRDGFSVIFMTSHTIQDSLYEGDFLQVVQGYRDNDLEFISPCENQVERFAGGEKGPEGYGVDAYCRNALMDRNGSEILNRRSRPVMARLGVPLVEGDLIVKDQEWATPRKDGRHYHMLVPVEVWELLGVLVSSFSEGDARAHESS